MALLPRILNLDQFLTSDENTNIFFAGSAVIQAFLQGNLRETYWHFYPGVTMSWLDSFGLVGLWLWERGMGITQQSLFDFVDNDILHLLIACRVPYAILTAIFIPIVYNLLQRLLPHVIALTASMFIAFDPFFLAHSRVVHADAPVAVFMVLSTLAFFIYIRQDGQYMFIFSAVMGSLAALTKAPGHLMAILVIMIAVGDWLITCWHEGRLSWQLGKRRSWEIVIWGGIAFAMFVLLWPAMWVDPIGILRQMLDETFGKVDEGHLVFFMGNATLNPGMWFYPYVIAFRLTPLTSMGVLLSVGMIINIRPDKFLKSVRSSTIFMWLFVIILLVVGMSSPKKQDRYLLPLFPMLDILAGIGWIGCVYLLLGNQQKFAKMRAMWLPMIAFVSMQFIFAMPHHPYYLTYFNELMGGLPHAVETTLVGWGEGMELAAAYLNKKPHAESLYVASTPSQTFLPYFDGIGENFYTNDIAMRADYVIIYQAQRQRLAPSAEIIYQYQTQSYEKVIELQGVPYVWIYPNTRLIFSDVPTTATLINIGFADIMRLAGYQVQRDGDSMDVVLFWHALSSIEHDTDTCYEQKVENFMATVCPRRNYAISLRLLDVNKKQIAQHDGWAANGLLPISQWQVDDYIQDNHMLILPNDTHISEYTFEVVVYNAQSQEILGMASFR